uniref:PAP-associated domain-containing protein n=2 Tax=Bursaphelenchus xylophilus TaxID=6326 RepID=A0A1I7RVN0_BURXY
MRCIEFWPSTSDIKEANRVTRRLYMRSQTLQRLEDKMMESYLRQRPSPAVERAQEKLIQLIEKQLQGKYPGCSIRPYGGSHNGFGTQCSDLDITIITPEIIREWNEEDGFVCHGILPKITNIVEILESEENRQATGLSSMENLELINIPLAKMEFEKDGHKIEVDFSSGNINGVRNTKILKIYSRIDERAVQLMTVIKKWAKKNELHGGPLYRFNTYSLVILVINFLQKGVSPPILPELSKITALLDCGLYDQSVEEVVALLKWEQRPDDISITELLIGFFAYYAQFNFSEWTVNLRRAQLTNRNTVGDDWYENKKQRISIECAVMARSPTRSLSEECYLAFRSTLNTMNKVIWQELAGGHEDEKTTEKIFDLMGL